MATNEFSFGVGLSQQPRFTVYDDDELQSLQVKKNAKRTKQSTTYGSNTLKKFCEERKIANFSRLVDVPINELADLLKKFSASACKKDGKRYKVNAIKGIRFALQRYFI